MDTTIPTTLAEFASIAGPFLNRQPALNQLTLGNIARLSRAPQPPDLIMAIVTHQGAPILTALRLPPYRLLLSHVETDLRTTETAAIALAEALAAFDISGALGDRPQTELFCAHYAALRQRTATCIHTMYIHELTQVIPPPPVPGHFRPALPSELPLLTAWRESFHVETQTQRCGETAAEAVKREFDAGFSFVWDLDGPVTTAVAIRPLDKGISIAGVYTPPGNRRKGYASACVAALSQYLLDTGYHYCTLFTDATNPTSNHIYHAIGYTPISDAVEIEFS